VTGEHLERLGQPTLLGLQLKNFRCFEDIALESLAKVNILAGPNNVGKSSLMLALRRLTRIDMKFVPIRGTPDGGTFLGDPNSVRWRPGDRRGGTHPQVTLHVNTESGGAITVAMEGADRKMTVVGSQKPQENLAYSTFRAVAQRIVYVPSGRVATSRLQRHDPTAYEERRYDGHDLLVDLAESATDSLETGEATRLRRIQALASSILETTVRLRPAIDPPALRVQIGEDPARNIDDLGEGITHAIVIAAAAASVACPLLLIEHPEMALHPLLQRRLLRFLIDTPGVQAFVATHSNHLLDVVDPSVAIFGLRCDSAGHRSVQRLDVGDVALLADLGVRPSSIAACNCVIWVEGPSDAIFIRSWLRQLHHELREWEHYTFAFFGGSLLEHIGVDSPEKLVRLIRVNPSCFVVADSDRDDETHPLGKGYLQCLRSEIDEDHLWITSGREVENYVSDRVLRLAFDRETTDQAGQVSAPGKPIEKRLKALGLPTGYSKVVVAQKVITAWNNEPDWPLDLHSRIETLAAFIEMCQTAVPTASRSAE
jgi:predicted ATPase